jgi:hypothetical protein
MHIAVNGQKVTHDSNSDVITLKFDSLEEKKAYVNLIRNMDPSAMHLTRSAGDALSDSEFAMAHKANVDSLRDSL